MSADRALQDGSRDRRDRRLLRWLALARDAGDALRALVLTGELLCAYKPLMRSCAVARLRDAGGWQAEDLEDVVAATMERLFAALARRRDHDALIPFARVVVANTKWAVLELLRARGVVELLAPSEMPEQPSVSEPALIEQVEQIRVLLEGLGARQRTIVLERALVDLPFGEIASRHAMRTKAVEKIATRALEQLRAEAVERWQESRSHRHSMRAWPRSFPQS